MCLDDDNYTKDDVRTSIITPESIQFMQPMQTKPNPDNHSTTITIWQRA